MSELSRRQFIQIGGVGAGAMAFSGLGTNWWGLDANGCCAKCGERLPGHFLAKAGDFGAQRIPVSLSRYPEA